MLKCNIFIFKIKLQTKPKGNQGPSKLSYYKELKKVLQTNKSIF